MSVCVCVSGACPNSSYPAHLTGTWYSIDQGVEINTVITADRFHSTVLDYGICHDLSMIEGSQDAQGHYDAHILIYNR